MGRILFAVGLAGLGVLSLLFADFALNWQPVPPWVPFRVVLAYVSGTVLLAGGIGTFLKRAAMWSTLVLAIFVLTWLLFLQVPRVASSPTDAGVWLGFGENSLLVSGGWILFASLAAREGRQKLWLMSNDSIIRSARILYAVVLPLIGISHFVYADFTASMVPAWLPYHVGFAYLTGTGHIAAGLGLLLGIFPRLAAVLEASMISTFVVLLHAPGVAAAPTNRLQWTMLMVATAYAGAAWIVAGSVRETPWWGVASRVGRESTAS
ncbi:MAG: DoxX family membrane protein [Lacunisphaera sp.]